MSEMNYVENGRLGVSRSAGLNPSQGSSLRARRLQRQQNAAATKAQADAALAEKEAERAENRKHLLAIQEELRRVREAKAATEEKQKDNALSMFYTKR